MTRIRLTAPVALAAVTLAATACGAARHTTTASATQAAPAARQTATISRSASTSATTPAASDRPSSGGAPAGGPVPRRFHPVSFTAISASDFWLLGTAPCSNPVCTSIVRTSDGGAHFVGLPAPAAPLASAGSGGGLADLRFADRLDGFAGNNGVPGPLWETHDGGAHWRAGLGGVVTFTVSGGHVYAVTGSCTTTRCTLRLASSPARADAWHFTDVPVPASPPGPSLTAHGASVWLSLTPAGGTPRAQILLASGDSGRTLAERPSPCTPGLGGEIEASSSEVLWATCPTGMMAGAWRSADGGTHWESLPAGRPPLTLPLSNGARIAPATDTTALLSTGGTGAVLRTTDGGRTFATVVRQDPNGSAWDWIGFTDPSTGSALRAGPGTSGLTLWRSHDGGSTWRGPARIG
jgi:photosystem II stability/assembly factor-like uncharacterized protein